MINTSYNSAPSSLPPVQLSNSKLRNFIEIFTKLSWSKPINDDDFLIHQEVDFDKAMSIFDTLKERKITCRVYKEADNSYYSVMISRTVASLFYQEERKKGGIHEGMLLRELLRPKNAQGDSTLHKYVMNDTVKQFTIFVTKCSDMFVANKMGVTPFDIVCRRNEIFSIVCYKDKNNETLLEYCLRLYITEPKVQRAFVPLMQAGADIHRKVNNRPTAFEYLCKMLPVKLELISDIVAVCLLTDVIIYYYKKLSFLSISRICQRVDPEIIEVEVLLPYISVPEDADLCAELKDRIKSASIIDADGNTPLHRAVLANNENLVRRYSEVQHKDLTVVNNRGQRPSTLAYSNGYYKLSTLLVNTPVNSNGDTLLHLAVKENKPVEVEALILEGADIFKQNNGEITPLEDAYFKGWDGLIYYPDYDHHTALHKAIISEDLKQIKMLLRNSVNNWSRSEFACGSPLDVLFSKGSKEFISGLFLLGLVKIIFDYAYQNARARIRGFITICAEIDLRLDNYLDVTSFLNELQELQKEDCSLCSAYATKLIINRVNDKGFAPLHIAVMKGNKEEVRDLLQKGADPLVETKEGKNSVLLAKENNNRDLQKLWIDLPLTSKGETLLYCAVEECNFEKIALCLEWGAQVNKNLSSIKYIYKNYTKDQLLKLIMIDSLLLQILNSKTALEICVRNNELCAGLVLYSLANKGVGLERLVNKSKGSLFNEIISQGSIKRKNQILTLLKCVTLSETQKTYAFKSLERFLYRKYIQRFSTLRLMDRELEYQVIIHRTNIRMPKPLFFQYWILAKGKPEVIYDLFRAECHIPGTIVYRSIVKRSELQSIALDELLALVNYNNSISDNVRELRIQFQGEEGIDAGGLSRTFISDLFVGSLKALGGNKVTNDLYFPCLRQDSDSGDFIPLSEKDQIYYEAFGELLMFVLNAHQFPCGLILAKGFFDGLLKFPLSYLHISFDKINFTERKVFEEFFSVFESLHAHTEPDQDKIKKVKEVVGYDRMEVIETQLIPYFSVMHAILMGMRHSSFTSTCNFTEMRCLELNTFESRIQGKVTSSHILSSLEYIDKGKLPSKIKKWLERWILNATEKQLKDFCYAITGAESLAEGYKIKVGDSHFKWNKIHTCFNTIDLCTTYNKEEFLLALNGNLLEAREYGFDEE